MNNREDITKYFRDYKNRVNDLLGLFINKTISSDVFKLNMLEDIKDMEDMINILVDRLEKDNDTALNS
jgi:hypothetical protein